MNKENEIEAMAKTIELIKLQALNTVGSLNKGYGMFYAEYLASAGYGNVKQYQDEIARLETELMHSKEDLVHADEKVFYREMSVKLDEEKIKKQAVKEFAERLKLKRKSSIIELKDGWTVAFESEIDETLKEFFWKDEKK